MRLAKAEVREEARKAAKGGAAIGAGGAVLYAALLFFGVTLVLLGRDVPAAVGLGADRHRRSTRRAGWAALNFGRQELRRTRPTRAVEHVKEDARWAKETMRDIKSSRSANA